MQREYQDWLRSKGYDGGTINAQSYRVGRVEEHYGNLDQHYDKDRLQHLIAQLTYSTEDKRRGRPNPSKIPFVGDIKNNLTSYKTAVVWYGRFRDAGAVPPFAGSEKPPPAVQPEWAPQVRVVGRAAKAVYEARAGARTLVDFHLDGRAALNAIIATSQYRTVAQAVASLTLFTHPDTVRQTEGKALFRSIRNQRRVGQIDEHNGERVLLDDNKSPTDAFLWTNGLARRGPDTQFNHVYTASLDVAAYTALPNICMTPAFIAKLTDSSEEVQRLLRYRTYQLYGWVPAGHVPPERPAEYEVLEWAAPLPPVQDVRTILETAMASKPKDRTVLAARELGWLFG